MIRQERSRPLVDAFFAWLEAQAGRVSRKSELGKAVDYMLGLIHNSGLTFQAQFPQPIPVTLF